MGKNLLENNRFLRLRSAEGQPAIYATISRDDDDNETFLLYVGKDSIPEELRMHTHVMNTGTEFGITLIIPRRKQKPEIEAN
jgi:hypothetical protein